MKAKGSCYYGERRSNLLIPTFAAAGWFAARRKILPRGV
jgi:hypothetical protein